MKRGRRRNKGQGRQTLGVNFPGEGVESGHRGHGHLETLGPGLESQWKSGAYSL